MQINQECENCGSAVSDTFARVYGDNDNNVHRCMHCLEEDEEGRWALRSGAGAFGDVRM